MKKLIIIALLGLINTAQAAEKSELTSQELTALQVVGVARCDASLELTWFDTIQLENGNTMVLIAERSTAKTSPQEYGVEHLRSVTFTKIKSGVNQVVVLSPCDE